MSAVTQKKYVRKFFLIEINGNEKKLLFIPISSPNKAQIWSLLHQCHRFGANFPGIIYIKLNIIIIYK